MTPQSEEFDDPFVGFDEWDSEADRAAFGKWAPTSEPGDATHDAS